MLPWRPELCVGRLPTAPDAVDLGHPDRTVDEAVAAGARTLVVGLANLGGDSEESWLVAWLVGVPARAGL